MVLIKHFPGFLVSKPLRRPLPITPLQGTSASSSSRRPHDVRKKVTAGALAEAAVGWAALGWAGCLRSRAKVRRQSAQPTRRIFASREVEMDGVEVIGYDLDYTLVHYNLKAWEGAVYTQCKEILRKKADCCFWEGLLFDSGLVIRGLVIDSKLGNIVKVDRYGYVRKALHGMNMLSPEDVNQVTGSPE
eukprot:g2128.t1